MKNKNNLKNCLKKRYLLIFNDYIFVQYSIFLQYFIFNKKYYSHKLFTKVCAGGGVGVSSAAIYAGEHSPPSFIIDFYIYCATLKQIWHLSAP